MQHFTQKIKKHECSKLHKDSCLKLSTFGTVNISVQLDQGYRLAVRRHNDEVSKNRHILSRLIDCVKFCGLFELALCGKDENEDSNNPGVFRGLVDLVASLDEAFDEHNKTAKIFKGTSKIVQNELLECMCAVIKEKITEEVKVAHFVALQADETTDVSTQTQLVLVLRDSFQQQQASPGAISPRRALGDEEKQRVWKEVCDTILTHSKERFSFTGHLISATLLQAELLNEHSLAFPMDTLNQTVSAYPVLNKNKLKTELTLICESSEFHSCCGALALYQVLLQNNL
ncbi:hypothetical protein WMY93_012706 [Mugilogobius chulae]|uniref:DUF4371 domain-containing protein n=1 Tax=Mugilogobius chulae TaxID=88201 RepID=A0AAW0P6Z9_9GOBI